MTVYEASTWVIPVIIAITSSATAFRELVTLAKALGVETFDRIFEAVFDLDLGDEFSVAAGAPDLFIWRPTLTPAVWFFSEVNVASPEAVGPGPLGRFPYQWQASSLVLRRERGDFG